MLGFLAVVWGASFLLIAIGLDAFTPGMVAWLRLIVAVVVLSALPAVRRSIDRRDWPAVTVVSIAGNAGPALLFAYAETTIESSLAGMLNAAVPLATASIAFLLGVRSLKRVHVVGLVLGFAGVVMLSLPSWTGSGAHRCDGAGGRVPQRGARTARAGRVRHRPGQRVPRQPSSSDAAELTSALSGPA
jgi:drug/metabolite transporter (DMT)-like permease